ncbi:SPOR domain-containing protein [Photobacterium indicum]|uniref:DamX-related protein n=1 Tax=Photobacterium indicum TaxID=81447 RepID=A0A2T3LFB8_9GAMM|nr:SPOR domain-containing protein [Photobacterium indicum]PSV50080.1 DamX-related protein [Photobacterium indicum]
MKKIAVLAVVTVLAGCASDSETMQLTTSSSEEVYSAEQIAMMDHLQEAKVETTTEDTTVAYQEEAVSEPVKPVEKPKKTVYKYADVTKQGYTIQVLALSHNQNFTTYMNKLPSNQPVWMNKKELQGLPWYTLLYGQFDSRIEAKRFLNALPQDVKNYGPFIRSLDDIKASSTPKLSRLN